MWHWWNGSVHLAFGSFINHLCGERDKGSDRAPLINPRGPARKSVLRTALTSRVPDYGRLDSACSPLRDSLHASVRRFQRGHNTLAAISQIKATQVSLKARFCRPDKAKPPSGNWCRGDNAGWRVTRLSGLRRFSGFVTVGRIRRSRHPAIVAR